ncbi:hypothetical protein Barb4_04249 [Bacteroidales bacterium Barb4]|nr:hypothetical protein Barb4_04249 [Bacteroidales bacterium Barb4]
MNLAVHRLKTRENDKRIACNSSSGRIVPVKINVLQIQTICKSRFVDNSYTVRNGYGSKGRTKMEGSISDASYPFLHSNGLEGRTVPKSTSSNAIHTAGNGYGSKGITKYESITSDAFYPFLHSNGLEGRTKGKSPLSNAIHTAGNGYGSKGSTVVEGIISDACCYYHPFLSCYPFLNSNGLEGRTFLKSTISNACHTAGNGYGSKGSTTAEGRSSDACCYYLPILIWSPFLNSNGLEGRTVRKSIISNVYISGNGYGVLYCGVVY